MLGQRREGRSSVVGYSSFMDLFALTRRLIDIESITGNEATVGEAIAEELGCLGYAVERIPVEGDRFNVWATHPGNPRPELVFSTHMDTVPPHVPSSESPDRIYGRGSCDAKGIIVAQIAAAEKLKGDGIYVGLLFLVGEERDSQGAQMANLSPRGAKFLVNGEPTENRIALASKGTLRRTAKRSPMEAAVESNRRAFDAQYRAHRRRPRAECHS